jgi:hypothetical protein
MRILILCLLFSLTACSKKEEKRGDDFESLMGKGLPAWQHVQTKEDFENLHFFKAIYETHKAHLLAPSQTMRIPKVIHYIWIGPKAFPRESVELVKGWIAKHPGWRVKFWTDRQRPLPHPEMELHLIKDFAFLKLEKRFNQSDNFGEKSDVLRYEILFHEGGVYVDHDVQSIRPFDSICASYDFFCGLEMPFKTALSSTLLPTNNIVGSRAGHPILKECLDWLDSRWDQIGRDYPGTDRDAVINRVSHRTFLVLGESVKKSGNQGENRDMVFPAFYFNAPKEEWALFSRHLYAGSWFENESGFEKVVRERLMKISKKTNQILLFVGLFSGLNILGFGYLFWLYHKKKAA